MDCSRPSLISGGAAARISTADLCSSIHAAVRRSCESKRYSRVCVLFVTWDWNQPSSADGLAAVWQLRDLLHESYGYETREVRLPSGQSDGDSYYLSEGKAHDSLKWAVRLFSRGSNARDTLFIFYYFGQARLEPTLETTWSQQELSTRRSMEFVLSCDDFDAWVETDDDDDWALSPVHTSVSFQSAVMDELRNMQADFLFLMDSPCGPEFFEQSNHLMFAACGLSATVDHGRGSLTTSVVAILTLAHKTKKWTTLGGMHSLMLAATETSSQNLPALTNRPVWHNTDDSFEDDPTILFSPLDLNEVALEHEDVVQKNISLLGTRLEGSYVKLRAHVRDYTDDTLKELQSRLQTVVSGSQDSQYSLELSLSASLGTVARFKSDWIDIIVDVLLYHNLAPHNAILFVEGPFVEQRTRITSADTATSGTNDQQTTAGHSEQ